MPLASPWYNAVSIPALLRHARSTYGRAMREALDGAGYGDIPKNGLYVIGGLATEAREAPLARIIADLGLSKQASGQLVDTLVERGYLERRVDLEDRRRLIVTLTERGRDAALVQTSARLHVDRQLEARVGQRGVVTLRKVLAALIGLGKDTHQPDTGPTPTPRMKTAIPILFVRDVTRAAAFFADELGFETRFLHGDPPFYGAVSRDGACLHLRFVGQPNFPELAAREPSLILVTIEVSDVRGLHAEYAARGVNIARDLLEHAWGGTDFHVRDPDGNEISFVQYRRVETPRGTRA
ncbi:glyoxalase superfamily protein [Solimonas marina]|uniref:MarR family transcriptional regulator n=1 Tax=Solimonas marina TaxID=2714601 RepID=A0A969WA78_9GAMM|nr:glyoxalase superfamily protein [Solimonas marina]NKF23217.1 MarR family transcriptional regulator [Solimonas marina]